MSKRKKTPPRKVNLGSDNSASAVTPSNASTQDNKPSTKSSSSRSKTPPRETWFRTSAKRLQNRKFKVLEPLLSRDAIALNSTFWLGLLGIVAVVLFSYWPTLLWLEHTWRTVPDYSHGYLVIPLAIAVLWIRRSRFPGIRRTIDWRGAWLIAAGILTRLVGRFAYMEFLDGWSIVLVVGGSVWLWFGLEAFVWSLPAVLFLLMLVPLPFRAESFLSWKLQGAATSLSTALLRVFGQPAIAEGHTVWIGEQHLMIEEACSGLRTFVGIIALAFFWAATVRRNWIDCVVIIIATLPLALAVNAFRIAVTGILLGLLKRLKPNKLFTIGRVT